MEIHDLTVGVVVPAGTGTSQARVVGCPSNTNYNSPAVCTSSAQLTSKVNPLQSWTAGPGIVSPGVRSDTIYVHVRGDQFPVLGESDVMNRQNVAEKIATIEVDTSNHNPPPIVLEGAEIVSPLDAAVVESFSDAVPTNEVALTQAGGLLRDLDGDGIVDDSDRCIYAYDPINTDRGGLNQTTADGIGDVCQCGDAHGLSVPVGSGGGVVNNADVMLIQQALTGQNTDIEVGNRCSVSGDSTCDIKDAVVLQLATDGPSTPAGPGVGEVCKRAVSVFTGDNQ
jgi:hypothetical protein